MYVVLKDKLPYADYQKQDIRQDADPKVVCTLHGTRTIKLGFVDDSTLFSKLCAFYSPKMSIVISLFQVKRIKPSEVQKEFHYISGHVIELLSHSHPKLLIKWCENLKVSETSHLPRWYEIHNIKLLPRYSVYKLRKLRTSSAILKMMSTFWSWSNHSVLTCLAEFSEIATALLEDFDSRLYLNSSITNIQSHHHFLQ